MTRITIPKTIAGKQVKGAMKRVLDRQVQPIPQSSATNQPIISANAPANININDYIQIPSGLYVAKERTLQGNDWYDSHKELHKQGLRMPTIPEMWETIFYLRDNQNNSELKQVYDDILEKTQSRWHGEWTNAKFKIDGNKIYMQSVTGLDSNGELIYSDLEEITFIEEDCYVDITSKNNINQYGLPIIKSKKDSYIQGENIKFWYPENDSKVAGFNANSDRACLGCDRGPDYRYVSLGVRGVASTIGAS